MIIPRSEPRAGFAVLGLTAVFDCMSLLIIPDLQGPWTAVHYAPASSLVKFNTRFDLWEYTVKRYSRSLLTDSWNYQSTTTKSWSHVISNLDDDFSDDSTGAHLRRIYRSILGTRAVLCK
jgi:hypothetical protein